MLEAAIRRYADTQRCLQRIYLRARASLPATGREYKEGAPDLEVYPAVQEELMEIEIWIPVR